MLYIFATKDFDNNTEYLSLLKNNKILKTHEI